MLRLGLGLFLVKVLKLKVTCRKFCKIHFIAARLKKKRIQILQILATTFFAGVRQWEFEFQPFKISWLVWLRQGYQLDPQKNNILILQGINA